MFINPLQVNSASDELNTVRATLERQNALLQQAKETMAKTQRLFTSAQNLGIRACEGILSAMHTFGLETEESLMERLEIMSMDVLDIKNKIDASNNPTIKGLRKSGSHKQIRWRYFMAVRGEDLTELLQEDDQADTEATIAEDRMLQADAMLKMTEIAKKKADEAYKAAKKEAGSASGSVDGSSMLSLAAMKEMYLPWVGKMTNEVKDFKHGDLGIAIYGEEGGTPGQPGQGQTPGMPRTIEMSSPSLPEPQSHLCMAKRLDISGVEPSEPVIRYYEIANLNNKGLAKITTKEFTTVMKACKEKLKAAPSSTSSQTTPLASPRSSEASSAGNGSTDSGMFTIICHTNDNEKKEIRVADEIGLNSEVERIYGDEMKAVYRGELHEGMNVLILPKIMPAAKRQRTN